MCLATVVNINQPDSIVLQKILQPFGAFQVRINNQNLQVH